MRLQEQQADPIIQRIIYEAAFLLCCHGYYTNCLDPPTHSISVECGSGLRSFYTKRTLGRQPKRPFKS